MGNSASTGDRVELKPLPFKHAKAVVLGGMLIIIPMYRKGKEDYNIGAGIYKYDFRKDEWNELVKYPKDLQMSCRAYKYDSNSNILTLYSSDDQQCMKKYQVNLRTKTWCTAQTKDLKDDGVSMYSLIDQKLHIIGNGTHRIWNETLQETCQVYEFEVLMSTGFHSIVHLERKQKLMIFGGFSEQFHRCTDRIYQYDLGIDIWRKCEAVLPMKLHLMGCTVTKDEMYVILLGGWGQYDDGREDSKNIFVYDVDKDEIYKSEVECPSKGQHRAVMSDNYEETLKLMHWYARVLGMVVPIELMEMISWMGVVEYVHVIKDKKHWRITLECVLIPA